MIPAYVWKITALGVVFIVLFVVLGSWQLGREAEKEALLSLADSQDAQPVIGAADFPGAIQGYEFRRVRLHGRFVVERTLLLDNRTRGGRPGREVLQAFLADGLAVPVLVNRGWRPLEAGEEMFMVPADGPVTIDAEIYRPGAPPLDLVDGVGASNPGNWPVIVQKIEPEALAALLGKPLHAVVLRLDADDPSAFVTDWPVSVMAPERHRAYAVQWFSLAVAVLLLVAWCWRTIPPREPDDGSEQVGTE